MFYGMTYNKFRETVTKKFDNANEVFEDEYAALDFANKSWNNENGYESEYNRLLVVVDFTDTNKLAFFQFTHYNACRKFINNRNEIIWSSEEKKVWNGDAKMMQ